MAAQLCFSEWTIFGPKQAGSRRVLPRIATDSGLQHTRAHMAVPRSVNGIPIATPWVSAYRRSSHSPGWTIVNSSSTCACQAGAHSHVKGRNRPQGGVKQRTQSLRMKGWEFKATVGSHTKSHPDLVAGLTDNPPVDAKCSILVPECIP